MSHRDSLLAALALFALFGSGCTRWYKGNIHTHSLWSDGDDFPEMIALWYRDHGYNFLALSDHNVLSRGERWMKLAEIDKRGGKDALSKYRSRLGDAWVELRGEGEAREVRLKALEEFRPVVEVRGEFILIEGEEISDEFEKLPIHLNATNLGEVIPPQHGKSVADVMRRNVQAVEAQAERLDRDILVHLNHPNFGYAVTAEDIAEVVEERFFEVYNGHPSVHNTGDEHHAPVERLWDIANTMRIARLGAAPLYGVATDDAHDYHGDKGALTGRGWIQVRAGSLDPESLIAAMEKGDFYASSGVVLDDVAFDADEGLLTIAISPAPGAEYETHFVGTRVGWDQTSEPVVDADGKPVVPATRRYSRDVGEVFAVEHGPRASYRLQGDELYVRAVVFSSLEPERPLVEGQRRQAWTQPVGWRGRLETSERPGAGEH